MAGVKRVIYTTCRPSMRFQDNRPRCMKTSEPVNPGDLYGVSKCFGEALGLYFAEQEGMPVIVLRTGALLPLTTAADPDNASLLHAFVSRRDLSPR